MPSRYYGIQNEVKAYCNQLREEQGIFLSQEEIKTINDRVESLKKSGTWSAFSFRFNDSDANDFISRAGVTDLIGKMEINWFITGLKSMGLWQFCGIWPLRSYQNKGSGSSVYGFGGAFSTTATAINSPTWDINGIIFSNNKYLNLCTYNNFPYNTGQYGVSMFSVVNPNGWVSTAVSAYIVLLGTVMYGQQFAMELTTGVGGGATMQFQANTVSYNESSLGASFINNYLRMYGCPSVINTPTYKNKFAYYGYSPVNTVDSLFIADSYVSTNNSNIQPVPSYGNAPLASVILQAGMSSTSFLPQSTMAITGFFTRSITSDQHQKLRNLYTQTLGKGLGLP